MLGRPRGWRGRGRAARRGAGRRSWVQMCTAAGLPPAVPTRYTSSLLQEPHTRGEKISQAFPMKSFPQALSTPSASWRAGGPLLPGPAAGCARTEPAFIHRRRAAPRPAAPPPASLGATVQSTFLLPRGGQSSPSLNRGMSRNRGRGGWHAAPLCLSPPPPALLEVPGDGGAAPTVRGSGEEEACECFQWLNEKCIVTKKAFSLHLLTPSCWREADIPAQPASQHSQRPSPPHQAEDRSPPGLGKEHPQPGLFLLLRDGRQPQAHAWLLFRVPGPPALRHSGHPMAARHPRDVLEHVRGRAGTVHASPSLVSCT